MPFCSQRATHLQGDQSAEGIARQKIRAARLESKNGLQIKVGHLLDSFARIIEALNSFELQTINPVRGVDILHKLKEFCWSSAQARSDEKRRSLVAGFEHHQRR